MFSLRVVDISLPVSVSKNVAEVELFHSSSWNEHRNLRLHDCQQFSPRIVEILILILVGLILSIITGFIVSVDVGLYYSFIEQIEIHLSIINGQHVAVAHNYSIINFWLRELFFFNLFHSSDLLIPLLPPHLPGLAALELVLELFSLDQGLHEFGRDVLAPLQVLAQLFRGDALVSFEVTGEFLPILAEFEYLVEGQDEFTI